MKKAGTKKNSYARGSLGFVAVIGIGTYRLTVPFGGKDRTIVQSSWRCTSFAAEKAESLPRAGSAIPVPCSDEKRQAEVRTQSGSEGDRRSIGSSE
jgi:hypothetical protein